MRGRRQVGGLGEPGGGEREGDDGRDRARRPQPPEPDRAPAARQEEQHQRPDQVELLLDRQRPEVVEEARGGMEEVVAAREQHLPVGAERRHADELGGQTHEHVAADHRGDGRGHGDDDDGGRQQAPDAADREGAQADRAGRVPLAQQQPGDQEAADDEEHVDAGVPARHRVGCGVEEHDRQQAERAQGVEAGVPLPGPGRRCGLRRVIGVGGSSRLRGGVRWHGGALLVSVGARGGIPVARRGRASRFARRASRSCRGATGRPDGPGLAEPGRTLTIRTSVFPEADDRRRRVSRGPGAPSRCGCRCRTRCRDQPASTRS
ncbi:hypothetical protein BFL35_09670 [Clavibacter michiganensis]|nr:hypothetical protein BFL35_09670 [Clavibacter michiganensis]